MTEIKQTNFRIDQASADAFRAFCEEQGFSQAQGFDHLMQVLELDQAKQAVPGREVEISEFEMHAKALLGAYTSSVALCANTEERVREEFKTQLASKDETIAKYQADLKKREQELFAALEDQKILMDSQLEIASLKAELDAKAEEIQLLDAKYKGQLADKERIISMTEKDLKKAQAEAEECETLRADVKSLSEALNGLEARAKNLIIENELALEKAARAAEKEKNEALEKAARMAEKETREAVAAAQAEVTGMAKELQMIEKQHSAEIRELMEKHTAELREVAAEKATLREELAVLRARLQN